MMKNFARDFQSGWSAEKSPIVSDGVKTAEGNGCLNLKFVDEGDRFVCPTSNNHILILKTMDEAGNVLPEFERKVKCNCKYYITPGITAK